MALRYLVMVALAIGIAGCDDGAMPQDAGRSDGRADGAKVDSATPVSCPTCKADEVCVYSVDMPHAVCAAGRAVCVPRADPCVADALAKPGAICSATCTASLCGSSKPVCSHNPCGAAPAGTGVSITCSWP